MSAGTRTSLSQTLLIRQREQSLYNRAKAFEHHKQLQQISEPGIGSKAVDGPKADCSNDNNDQYADQNRNDAHSAQLLMMPKISICGLYRRVNIERLPQATSAWIHSMTANFCSWPNGSSLWIGSSLAFDLQIVTQCA